MLVFPQYKKCWCAPLRAVNFLYDLKILKSTEFLFHGNLGTWHGKTYDIKRKPDAEPYHVKPFPVPFIHELTFKQELGRLGALKVVKKFNRSQWGAPTFLIPKKYSTVHFIYDFRELNKCILRRHDLIISIGIDIHGADMIVHWDDAAIPLRDIDSITNDVFAL